MVARAGEEEWMAAKAEAALGAKSAAFPFLYYDVFLFSKKTISRDDFQRFRFRFLHLSRVSLALLLHASSAPLFQSSLALLLYRSLVLLSYSDLALLLHSSFALLIRRSALHLHLLVHSYSHYHYHLRHHLHHLRHHFLHHPRLRAWKSASSKAIRPRRSSKSAERQVVATTTTKMTRRNRHSRTRTTCPTNKSPCKNRSNKNPTQ